MFDNWNINNEILIFNVDLMKAFYDIASPAI